ncbi:BQ2448_1577 [Microbotryum intermedium]|uniref:BQ2448_1577 protein n=1 Tax=Microbotryum intermedium TaxID=269621 RepID=A0A238FDU4_9BASI|nr:BQ2448_1577 [Microbotryum intermedium]
MINSDVWLCIGSVHCLTTVNEGQGDIAQPLLAKVRECAESDKEPGCLTFRTSRGSKEEGKGDEFMVYEEYASREALRTHRGLEAFLALAESGLIIRKELILGQEFKLYNSLLSPSHTYTNTTSASSPSTQSRVILINRPTGDINPDIHSGKGTFKLEKYIPVEQPKEGQALIKVEWSSIDPAMRGEILLSVYFMDCQYADEYGFLNVAGWLDDSRSYMPPVPLNSAMRAGTVGSIVALGPNTEGFSIGDHVSAYLGWQEYAVAPVGALQKIPAELKEPEKALSVLGVVAQTAYWGLFDVAQLTSKDKLVVVSGAAGAVGSIAIQLAKLTGRERVVGIAGGADKCHYVKKTLGADECLDYKSASFKEDLKNLGFVDVYFDNVGGEILDMIMGQLAVHARIAFCGAISTYNSTGDHYALKNYVQLLMQKAKLHGFIIMDYVPRFGESLPKLSKWYLEGKLQLAEHKIEGGVEQCVDALCGLFTGVNTGKAMVHIAKD